MSTIINNREQIINNRKQIINNNMSLWNKIWNNDIKDVVSSIDLDIDIVSSGQVVNYKNLGNKFLGKFFVFIYEKLNLKNKILFKLSKLFSILFSFIFVCVTFRFIMIFLGEKYFSPEFAACFIYVFCLFFIYFNQKIFYYLNLISRSNYFGYIFYFLTHDSFYFYKVINNEFIEKTKIDLKDIRNIYVNDEGNYQIVTQLDNIFYINTDKKIPEIENLDVYKETKDSLKKDKKKELEISFIKL